MHLAIKVSEMELEPRKTTKVQFENFSTASVVLTHSSFSPQQDLKYYELCENCKRSVIISKRFQTKNNSK